MMRASRRPLHDIWLLAGVLLAALITYYALAADQGFLLSLVQGAQAFDINLLHEALHDARHAAGFPCH